MELNTASSAISFSGKLEDDSAMLYEEMARRYPEAGETFRAFVRDNKRHKTLVNRVYYGVISDAIEGGFSFEGLDTDDFVVETRFADNIGYSEALNTVIEAEERIVAFYRAASEASRSLMADVPRVFNQVVRKRSGRIDKLKSLLGGAK